MFGIGTRKQAPIPDRTRVVGIDLTASRARAVALAAGRTRALVLDDPAEDLLLFLALDRRLPDVGAAGYHLCRKTPHLVCSNFLPQLGHPRRWQAPRCAVTPESALQTTFEKLRDPVVAETDAAGLSLPAYLTANQVRAAVEQANKAKLPVRGTASAPLAVAAHRAAWVLSPGTAAVSAALAARGGVLGMSPEAPDEDNKSGRDGRGPREDTDDGQPDWVVPMPRPTAGPAAVVVVDADEFALTASVVGVEANEVKSLASALWPRASLKAWKDRLVDALSDRCIRLCRRDPRDSADAEQALYEQLDGALDRTQLGHPVTLGVRGSHWYQDLVLRASDLDGYCAAPAKLGADGVRELVRSANLPVPPRAVWLTHAAARLPGLAAAIHQGVPEQTEVLALPPNAAADAAAALVPFWLTAMIPRVHLDVAIPLVGREAQPNAALARSAAPHGI
ncbi:MAG TPA: hypothetical protein VFG68_08475 [Fimbriiglobus sp.]|nr:hypothetical protein [Fimbriiglobus sp.]